MALMKCLALTLPSAESQFLYPPPPPPSFLKNNTWQTNNVLALVRLRRHERPDFYVLPENQIVTGKSQKEPKSDVGSNFAGNYELGFLNGALRLTLVHWL